MKFMAKIIVVFHIMILVGAGLYGKIWTVDNNAGHVADFTTATDAINSANVSPGDTLMFVGSPTLYDNPAITKRLVLIGPGFFLDENPELQANPLPAKLGGGWFKDGSAGSVMMGLYVTTALSITEDSITVSRNFIESAGFLAISIGGPVSNIVISHNYITGSIVASTRGIIEVKFTVTNLIISGNYILNGQGASETYAHAIYVDATSSAVITHNVLDGPLKISNSILENNILILGALTDGGNNQFAHNLANASQFGATNGNQELVDMSTVFAGTGSTDGQWQLAGASPAIAAGIGGVDCGMFGGQSPYVLSGLPSMPVITFLSVPTTGSQSSGLKIHIKARGQN